VAKLVVLKLGDGNFEQGFAVTLQIGEDGDRPATEITGKLPKAPEILQHYRCWQSAYRSLGWSSRLEAAAIQVTNVSLAANCYKAAQVLRGSLNSWLYSEPFRSIREKLLEKLLPSDEVRVILQTEDMRLQRLPWHLWDWFERYPKAEIALSAPAYERVGRASLPRDKVRILAILGSSTGINIQADRALLEQLPGAEISFLVEPQRQELTQKLWGQGWDVIFFAGHSSSQAILWQDHDVSRQGHGKEEETSRIWLNQTDSLTIDDLGYALKTAVEQGLKLAIFNSCDGLGLAQELAKLQIPQLIVMREPIPDQVAQEFLKYFLAAFARGESLYLAVREARERLQGLEEQFPCATWLPVICQNPAELPPTWLSLRGVPTSDRKILSGKRSLRTLFVASVAISSLLVGVRQLGLLQPLELQAFDQLLQMRPTEGPDPRLLVVTVTAADVQSQQQKQGSLSDRSLNQLLQKLGQFKPQAIGLDIYRPFPVEPNYADLRNRLQQNDRLVAVCKVSDPKFDPDGVGPPPEVPSARQGFSDVVADDDNIIRRQLLELTPPLTSRCATKSAFSLDLALAYLDGKRIQAKVTPEGYLQFGNVVFKELTAHAGGYQTVDAGGHQLLLNYRPFHSLQDIAPQVTLTDILHNRITPTPELKGRIVLIGVTDQSFGDYWSTPYSPVQETSPQQIPGVFLQAQMVSQLLSAVLDRRPLLWVWPQWGEVLWIWGWALVGGLLTWRCRSPLRLGIAVGAALGTLYALCFALLTQGGWVPLVPSALAVVATGVSVVAYPRKALDSAR